MKLLKDFSSILKETVGLEYEPAGIKFHTENRFQNSNNEGYRLCQAVMKARHGKTVFVTKENISCPAAAAALGLKPLPKNLQDGSMLCGYGIFKEKESGINVMNSMLRLELGKYSSIEVKPLLDFSELPDVVALEDEVEKLMWIALAYLNEKGGRLDFSTSILQAVCVDSVVLPFLSGKINMSFGCYGCRDATDAQPNEAILGFPGSKLEMVIANLEHLNTQAIQRSRAKSVYKAFEKRNSFKQVNQLVKLKII
ncbi:MAG: DUF169 domain-containing protein [Ignavibacteriaceae bacterium]